jgi:hypothetical protein
MADDLEQQVRVEQTRVLRALADRIERGEALLSTDVFQDATEDLELRIDSAAIADAWANEPEPPAIFSSKPPGGKRPASSPHPIRIFQSADRALEALPAAAQEEVRRHVEGLANDALPKGVVAMHCHGHGTHLRMNVGHHRILYRVRSGGLLVVAITST